jgi:hypothetical protein
MGHSVQNYMGKCLMELGASERMEWLGSYLSGVRRL